jgi:pyruvate dehydrogenase E2 component (dihydrolipoamide acetyltransferase)
MPTEILMPALSPTMEEGTLAKWLVKEGDTVASGDILAEIETDKATMEFEAVEEGVIGKILVEEGTEGVKVNAPIAVLLDEGESASDIDEEAAPGTSKEAPKATEAAAPAPATPPAKPHAPAAPQAADGARIFASPLARRIAADKGLDLSQVKGSGPHGRIVKADVEGASAAPQVAAAAPAATAAPGAKAAVAMPAGPDAAQVMKMYEGRDFE